MGFLFDYPPRFFFFLYCGVEFFLMDDYKLDAFFFFSLG